MLAKATEKEVKIWLKPQLAEKAPTGVVLFAGGGGLSAVSLKPVYAH
jgi:hypothetical protein